MKDGDNTWTGKNDYKEYPTSEVEQTSTPEKSGDSNIYNQLVRYQTVVDYIKEHPTGEGTLDDYLNKETGGTVTGPVEIHTTTTDLDTKTLVVKSDMQGSDGNTVFKVETKADDGYHYSRFQITSNGAPQAGYASSPFIATASHDLVTKSYTDTEFKYVGNRPAPTSWEDGLKRAGQFWIQNSQTGILYFSMIKAGGGMFIPPWPRSDNGSLYTVPVGIYVKEKAPDWSNANFALEEKPSGGKTSKAKTAEKDAEDSAFGGYSNKPYVWPNGLRMVDITYLLIVEQPRSDSWHLPVLKIHFSETPAFSPALTYYFRFGA